MPYGTGPLARSGLYPRKYIPPASVAVTMRPDGACAFSPPSKYVKNKARSSKRYHALCHSILSNQFTSKANRGFIISIRRFFFFLHNQCVCKNSSPKKGPTAKRHDVFLSWRFAVACKQPQGMCLLRIHSVPAAGSLPGAPPRAAEQSKNRTFSLRSEVINILIKYIRNLWLNTVSTALQLS